jgi:threonylcarbamoyladenosine tRNA methylthiotransferase MtaB
VAEYHVENFGCRASRADGEIISAELRHRGLSPASSPARADVIVVNTCSVTAQADRTARAFLRRVHRENPSARILVTGCYAQRAPQEVAALPGVHAVVGNSHKALVPSMAEQAIDFLPKPAEQAIDFLPKPAEQAIDFLPKPAEQAIDFLPKPAEQAIDLLPKPAEQAIDFPPQPAEQAAGFVPLAKLLVDDTFAHSELSMPQSGWYPGGQTRPNLKVQDGCGNRCSFCIIPTTRGHSRSLSLEACLESVRTFADAGGTEMVLSGINLGRWGRDLEPQRTLEELVSEVLSRTSLPRLRLSSIEPMDWTPQLLALFRGGSASRLARHAHLPLQSGSDAILRAMHRRYRPWHYAEKLRLVREIMPDAAIGADVMVGFPGETHALFEESFAFIAAQPFTYLHLFPFSARPGTTAWQLAEQHPVAPRVVAERSARLRELIAARNLAFRKSFLDRELPAVTLHAPAGEGARALTDNFLQVRLDACLPANQSVRVRISGLEDGGLTGRLAV